MYRAVLLFFACIFGLQVQASQMGDDGLHKAPWMRETFKDMREDLEDANLEGKRLLLLIEQRGCVYCRKMHEQVFADPEVKALLEDKYFVVQLNMFGDVEVTDFDGTALPEKEMAKRWRLLFTPTMLFFPEFVSDTRSAPQAAVVTMPGAFSKFTTLDLLTWVFEKGYEGDENFQKYHARRFKK